MALSQADRIAFSLTIVQAPATIAAIQTAKGQLATAIANAQSLDTANTNLFTNPNDLVNHYSAESTLLDGNVRTTIVEQDIQDSANKKLQNHFYPNDTSVTVPTLSAFHNVWTQFAPFASTYAIGLNYVEAVPSTILSEPASIAAINALITSLDTTTDIENTSGQTCAADGTCSLPSFTTEPTCLTGGGIWTPGAETISTDAAIVAIKVNLVAAIVALQTLLTAELAAIPTNDSNSSRQTQNTAAIANIAVIQAALVAWLANPDFQAVPNTVTTCSEFFAYDPNLLAPTKLHSAQLATLTGALAARNTFITTRLSQLNTNLGSIVQSAVDGSITSSSGLYAQRYDILSLRLNLLTGSLTILNGLKATIAAQNALIASITQNKNTYYGLVPTSLFQAPGNSTSMVSLVDVSFVSQGDVVYLIADNQPELVRGIKSINGNSLILTDVVPPQYDPASNGRLYKDNT